MENKIENKAVVTKTKIERVEQKTVETKTIDRKRIPKTYKTPEEKLIENILCIMEDYFHKAFEKLRDGLFCRENTESERGSSK